MEKYELKNRYDYEDDEIDLVELFKTILRERKIVIAVTILFTFLAGGFAFYKNNKSYNYGVEISISSETADKINQYNGMYKNSAAVFNQNIQNSFDELLNQENPEIIVLSSENKKEILEVLKEKYNFIKIVDTKNKSYKLFTKVKENEIEKISEKIDEIVSYDTEKLNRELEKNISEELAVSENKFLKLTEETKKLNKDAMKIINENFKNILEENITANFSIISPVLYVEYQEKINSLNGAYLKAVDLKKIQSEAENLFELSGKDDIKLIELSEFSKSSSGLSSKLILAAGIILGLFAGMFIAIIKEPLKNILKEIKEEK